MSVSSGSDDASEASTRELLAGLTRQWKVWFVVVASVAIVGFALRPRSEAPEGYVPFFLAVAVVGLLYGVERTSAAPNPIAETLQY